MHDYLLVILAVGWALTGVAYRIRTRSLLEANEYLHDSSIESSDRAIDAERRASSAETELGFLKSTVVQMLNRPQVVVMSEDQFGHLVQTIQAAVEATVRPNSIN